jgi:glycosyltransferase involved in cell wall biosynthesis
VILHLVVPDGVRDPARPSGGNVYDRRACDGLAALGWSVQEHPVPGVWPRPDRAARTAVAGVIAALADGSLVLIDGLIASTVPEILVPAASRLRLVVLVHMPLGAGRPDDPIPDAEAREGAVLSAAAAVITTSAWARQVLLGRYRPRRVDVAEPGTDPAELAPGTPTGGALLSVAAVTPHKGLDMLLAALAMLADQSWQATFVGPLDRDLDFVARLRVHAAHDGLADRITFAGPLAGRDFDAAYAAADVLVHPSHAETYGMVVAEALAHGLPVITTATGGLPATLGRAADGTRPGLLVPPGDPAALAAALRAWLTDADLRTRLRRAAADRRTTLPTWSDTTRRIAAVLRAAAPPRSGDLGAFPVAGPLKCT